MGEAIGCFGRYEYVWVYNSTTNNMSDALKIFIQQNREAFDAEVPAGRWLALERILQRLPEADQLERQILCDRALMDTAAPSESIWKGIEKALEDQNREDSLESFIRQNRPDFDAAAPRDQAWEHISQNLPKPKAIRVHIGWQRSILRIAASLTLLLAGVGAGIWYERQVGSAAGMAMSDISDEYKELEQFYQRDISVKREKLATFTGSQPAEVGEDLKQLDEIMEQLRQELANVPPGNREQVVRAMINNYKAKTAILQRVLERLEGSTYGGDNSKQSNGIKNM